MNTDQLHEFILDYLDGNLDPTKLDSLTKELESLGYDLNNLEELLALVNTMDEIKIPEPSKKMDDKFYSMLEEEINVAEQIAISQSIKNWMNTFFFQAVSSKFSYGFIMLLIGLMIGFWITPNAKMSDQISQMNEEMKQMKEMVMVNLLDQPKVSDRLQAMNIIRTSSLSNDNIIESLINVLNHDSDVNVRMAAVEALFAFANQDKVREELKKSINQQNSPLVQLTMLDGFISIGDKTAIPIFENLINRDDILQEVKDRSREGITKLI